MQGDEEGGLLGEDGDASGDGVALLHARFLAGLGAFAAAFFWLQPYSRRHRLSSLRTHRAVPAGAARAVGVCCRSRQDSALARARYVRRVFSENPILVAGLPRLPRSTPPLDLCAGDPQLNQALVRVESD
jgi:hypothetical protein